MNIKEFIEILEGKFEKLKNEEGLKYGNINDIIKGITVCWMLSKKVLNSTIKVKNNLIISHEDLFFPPEYAGGKGEGVVSEYRKNYLDKYRINFLRLHYLVDKYFILDEFDKLAGGKLILKEGFYRVYKFENVKLYEIAEKLKKKFKIKFLRISGKNKNVKRAGCLWGGLGLSINSSFIDKLLSFNVDTVIAGEVDEYTIRALNDLNISIIEIGHEASEFPGLIKFAKFLKENFSQIPVIYVKNNYPVFIL